MRSSVDRLASLVGTPYADGGKSPETGFDCWGLILYATKLEGRPLPDDIFTWSARGSFMRLYYRSIRLKEGERPSRLDILCFAHGNSLGLVDHLGIGISETDFIHADKKCGSVVCEPIRRHKMKAVLRLT